MTYSGYKELKIYLTGNDKPSFNKFVRDNTEMLPQWSVEENATTVSALHGIWYERYKQVYGKVNQDIKNLTKPKYNCFIWNTIINNSTRKRLRSTYREAALDLLIEARQPATEEARQVISLSSSVSRPSSSNQSETSL